MRLGVMQPYFFPYAQQLRHIAQCDRWISFDTPQFTRKSWITRNRIADRNTGWTYISVPVVKGASRGSIAAANLASSDWRQALRDQLRVYDGAARYYDETISIVERCLGVGATTIGELNTRVLGELCTTLEIGTPIDRLSELDLGLPDSAEPGDWALLVSQALGASVYSNAPGGRHLFDPQKYRDGRVDLEFYEPAALVYPTPGFTFEPGLSIVDTLMWLGPARVSEWCHAGR